MLSAMCSIRGATLHPTQRLLTYEAVGNSACEAAVSDGAYGGG